MCSYLYLFACLYFSPYVCLYLYLYLSPYLAQFLHRNALTLHMDGWCQRSSGLLGSNYVVIVALPRESQRNISFFGLHLQLAMCQCSILTWTQRLCQPVSWCCGNESNLVLHLQNTTILSTLFLDWCGVLCRFAFFLYSQ